MFPEHPPTPFIPHFAKQSPEAHYSPVVKTGGFLKPGLERVSYVIKKIAESSQIV